MPIRGQSVYDYVMTTHTAPTDTDTRASRPAYIADAHDGDSITYTAQRVNWKVEPPVVIDTPVTTRVVGTPTRSHNGMCNVITWRDSDGVVHTNRSDFHITIN